MDVQTLYDARGQAIRVERDLDHDGAVDVWQELDARGRVVRSGTAPVRGRPTEWLTLDEAGKVVRREIDRDADGRLDWREEFEKGVLVGQGRPDAAPR